MHSLVRPHGAAAKKGTSGTLVTKGAATEYSAQLSARVNTARPAGRDSKREVETNSISTPDNFLRFVAG